MGISEGVNVPHPPMTSVEKKYHVSPGPSHESHEHNI